MMGSEGDPGDRRTMSSTATKSPPTVAEEIVHAATHGFGLLLSLATLVTMTTTALVVGAKAAIAAAVFGSSLVAVYASSTVYHAIPARLVRAKAVARILDHAAIHLLIAGTLTPFALCAVGGVFGTSILAASWVLAAVGIAVEVSPLRHRARLSLGLYVGAGWFGVVMVPSLLASAPPMALVLLALGGVAYTAGVPFFLADHRRWMHALWHGFVLAGSALHVASIAWILV